MESGAIRRNSSANSPMELKFFIMYTGLIMVTTIRSHESGGTRDPISEHQLKLDHGGELEHNIGNIGELLFSFQIKYKKLHKYVFT